jgi:hypothetical protein
MFAIEVDRGASIGSTLLFQLIWYSQLGCRTASSRPVVAFSPPPRVFPLNGPGTGADGRARVAKPCRRLGCFKRALARIPRAIATSPWTAASATRLGLAISFLEPRQQMELVLAVAWYNCGEHHPAAGNRQRAVVRASLGHVPVLHARLPGCSGHKCVR